MNYQKILPAIFISRPNRFIAQIKINEQIEICHVKNTGRCKELLIPGAKIYVQYSDNPIRKTKYDLISVIKGNRLINIDSQAPNKIFYEWLLKGNLIPNITMIKPETTYGNSRFDFYIETLNSRLFIEVKGVTLEEDDIVLFPDAPTKRGVKHLNELIHCLNDGYEAMVVFIIQMEHIRLFTPNRKTHSDFADALLNASAAGVQIIALDCNVTSDSISANNKVDVNLII